VKRLVIVPTGKKTPAGSVDNAPKSIIDDRVWSDVDAVLKHWVFEGANLNRNQYQNILDVIGDFS
jgi:hypothetical protein